VIIMVILYPDYGVNSLPFGSSISQMESIFGDKGEVVFYEDGSCSYSYWDIGLSFFFENGRLDGVVCDNVDCVLLGQHPIGKDLDALGEVYNVFDFCMDDLRVEEENGDIVEMCYSDSIGCIFGLRNGVVEDITINVSYDNLDPIFPV